MTAKFRCFSKAMYMGREVQIIGVTYGHVINPRSGIKYDLRVTNGMHSYDYKNVPESHLKEIPKPKQNEVLDFCAAANHSKKAAEKRV